MVKKFQRNYGSLFLGLFMFVFICACTSISDLPRRATDVNFVDHVSGIPSSREYDHCANYLDVELETMLEAVKFSMVKNNFDIKQSSISTGVIRAEHGMSARDWNIVAGVYFKVLALDGPAKGVAVKIIVRTAASTSLFRDENGSPKDWTHKILSGIDVYLQRNISKKSTTMKCG